MNAPRRSFLMELLGVMLAIAVFVLDLVSPKGLAEAVLYVIIVLVILRSSSWRHALAVAAACSVLSIAGLVLSSPGVSTGIAITNHAFSLLVIWVTAILGRRMNRLSDDLRESEARTRTIVETAAEGIITTSDQGIIESINQSAARMFGYDDIADVIGQNVTLLIPLSDREAHERGLANYLKTGQTEIIGKTREVRGLHKDGTTFPLLIAVSEMWLQQRRVFAGILLDMTALRTAQDRAVQAGRLAAIGEAMTGLAHESRNALQRSQAALEMLARAIGDRADAMDLIDRIQAAQDDLHRLYEGVRGYAAPVILRPQTCRVDLLVQEAWEQLAVARMERTADLQQRGIEIDLTCDADPFAIQQVFRNIMDNSLAAIDDPVHITAAYVESQIDGRPAIEVVLQDNGPGLTDEMRESLFEPFFTTKTSGTGLGMPIAKRLIDAHGGILESPRTVNPGAIFRVILPRTQSCCSNCSPRSPISFSLTIECSAGNSTVSSRAAWGRYMTMNARQHVTTSCRFVSLRNS